MTLLLAMHFTRIHYTLKTIKTPTFSIVEIPNLVTLSKSRLEITEPSQTHKSPVTTWLGTATLCYTRPPCHAEQLNPGRAKTYKKNTKHLFTTLRTRRMSKPSSWTFFTRSDLIASSKRSCSRRISS